ncbi:MAG: glycosyltransferase [Caldilineaceae bacterium]|nr:glycosyltransferase [Caldilineaceae bacterium]
MPTILILMSDTGGGHRASAQALQAGFTQRYGDRFRVEIVDLWKSYTPWPMNRLPNSYSPLVNRGIAFWKFIWFVSEKPTLTEPVLATAERVVRRTVRRMFHQYRPDLVISVHPLLSKIPEHVLHHERPDVPFVTVITDLGTITPMWFHRGVDRCFVPTQAAYEAGLRQGLTPQQLKVCGLPVRPAFARAPRDKTEVRSELELDPDRLTALIVGGGEGMGPVAKIVEAAARRLSADGRNAQLVVICGRNEKLRANLSSRAWPLPVRVLGFVDNMPDWMAAADCIVTKAGPGTIAEAMISGLPILLSGYIPGQETGNIPFVVESGAGAFNEDPAQIAAILSHWFGPQQHKLAEMAAVAKSLGRPQSTIDIVEEIAEMVRDA